MCFKTFVYIVLPSHVSGLKLKVSFFVFDIFLLFPVKKAFKIFWKIQLQISNVFFITYSQSEPILDLPSLRLLCGEALGRDSNPGGADWI